VKRSPVGCFLIVLLLFVLAIPALAFTMRANEEQAIQAQSADLQFHVIGNGDVEVAITAVGSVEADESASLNFSGAGQVAEIFVQQGAVVTQGTPIARLENETQMIAVQQARLAVELAQLRKDDLLAGPDAGDIAVAEANIEAARGAAIALQQVASADDIRAAELAVEQADAALLAAQEARQTAQAGQPEQAYQLLDARVGQASFNAEIARLQLEQARTGNSAQVGAAYERVDQAEAQLAQLMAGPRQSQIDSADAAIAQAQAALDRAQRSLDDTILVAPFDGVLSSLTIEVGAVVSQALPVGQILDVTPLRVRANVDEIDVREISEQMPATLTFDALEDVEFAATLEEIAVLGVNNAGIINYPVTLRLDDVIDMRVLSGMTAEASMVVESVRGVLVVPNEYVRLDREDDRAFVNIVTSEGTLVEIEIALGLQGDDLSEVVSGLQVGDVIAVDLGGDIIPAFGG
jgi:HlyD family secretion protein